MTFMTEFISDYKKGDKVWIVINNTVTEVTLLSKSYPAGNWEVSYWAANDKEITTYRHERYFNKTMNACFTDAKERGVYITE